MITDFMKYIKALDARLKILERSSSIKNLTIPDDGTFIVPKYASDPVSGTQGQIYYNTTSNKFRGYDGSSWGDLN